MKSDGTTTTTTRHDFLPFGEEIQSGIGGRTAGVGYAADNVRQKFTQKERDNESGLDYFGARYYASPQGRFTSVDPKPVTVENFVNPQRWNLYIYVNNNPLAAVDPNGGDGEGKGGDKVISVFLVMSTKERNTWTQNGKKSVVGAPNWDETRSQAGRNGYDLQVFGTADVAGKGASPVTSEGFESALKNSEVAIYVDHGVGDTLNPFIPSFIEVAGKGYYSDGSGKVNDINGRRVVSPGGDKPDASASVIGNFSCNSSANSGFFNYKGTGQILVTINSGKDGLPNYGWYAERAANAFVKAYTQTKGSTEDRVNAGIKAANSVIYQDRGRKSNRRDKVEEQRVN